MRRLAEIVLRHRLVIVIAWVLVFLAGGVGHQHGGRPD